MTHNKPARLLRNRFGSLYVSAIFFIAISTIIRVSLLSSSLSNIDINVFSLLKAFSIGFFFDMFTYFIMVLPMAIYLMVVPDRIFKSKINRYIMMLIYFCFVFIMLFDVVSDWLFWDEFGSQFNFIAVDYLIYTREVIGNAMESYPVKTLITIILAITFFIVLITKKYITISYESVSSFSNRLKMGTVYLLMPVLSILFVNLSLDEISLNHYNNELAKNNLFSLASSFFYNSIDYRRFYRTMNETKVSERLKTLLKTKNSRYDNEHDFGIGRTITSDQEEIKKNIVLVVVESLSARYLGVFGNQEKITPNLDVIARKSLFFSNIYATGTRTTRGLEAVTLSVPPTPGRSIIKRPHNENMFNIGTVLMEKGYETKFIYGGYGYFDNMNDFYRGNGFEIVDRSNMKDDEITFSTTWGVCDGDLYNRVLSECDASMINRKPFFSIVMTTSNHRPYTYPQKIDIPSGSGRKGAVKYTDYTIGEFLRKAETRPWFKDTIFVFIADHCAHSAGDVEVPVSKYKIPLMVYAPGFIKPGECTSLCSQIDLPPTLFGLLNMSYKTKFFGQDVLRDPPGRALLGTYQKLGLFTKDRLTLLEPGKKVFTYFVGEKESQTPALGDDGLLFDTISYYQSADYLIKHNLLLSF